MKGHAIDSSMKPVFRIVKDYSLSMERALVELFALAIPLLAVQAALWLWMWDLGSLTQGLDSVLSLRVGGPLFVVGVLTHELVHGVTWKVVGRLRWKDIRFGVQLKTFTPYASPTVPMRARTYRMGVMMPLIVVGLIPFAVGLIFEYSQLAVFGMVFTFVAGGDLAVLRAMRSVASSAWVQDHPERAGCYVVAA
jgi:hypothetical protein